MLLLMDNSMNNSYISTLSIEHRNGSSPFTITTVSPIIQSVVDILFDPRNVATTSKPNVACGTTVKNIQNYSEHVLYIHSPLTIRASAETRLLLCTY